MKKRLHFISLLMLVASLLSAQMSKENKPEIYNGLAKLNSSPIGTEYRLKHTDTLPKVVAQYLIDDKEDTAENVLSMAFRMHPKALYIVNGREVSPLSLMTLRMDASAADALARVNILHQSKAVTKYGKKGKYGAIEYLFNLKNIDSLPAYFTQYHIDSVDRTLPIYVGTRLIASAEKYYFTPKDISSIRKVRDIDDKNEILIVLSNVLVGRSVP